MKHQIDLRDTLIVMQHEKIQVCQSKGDCKNHPNKFVWVHREINTDSLIQTEAKTDSASSNVFVEVEKEIEQPVLVHQLTAFDTIKPCDSQFLIPGDTRSTSEFIEFPSEQLPIKRDPIGDHVAFSMVCGFMAYLAAKYVADCYANGYWSDFISDLKTEWNS
jgi:hypothetical protein